MATVIKISEDFEDQKIKAAAKIAKKEEKNRIKNSLKDKKFSNLSSSEKDDLLKFIAIKFNLIEE